MSEVTKYRYGTGYGSGKNDRTDLYLWRPILKQLSQLPKGSHVLDAGCGNGFFAQQLNAMGFDVCGVDWEETGIANARRLCENVRFEVASVYDDIGTRFGRHFDAVVSLEVIEHLYAPRDFLHRIYQSLRPGGTFIVSTPYHGYLKNLLIAMAAQFDSHASPLWDGGHIKFWSRKTLTTLLKECGFHFTTFIGAGRCPYLWKSMIIVAHRT